MITWTLSKSKLFWFLGIGSLFFNMSAAVLAVAAMYNKSPGIGIASAIFWLVSSIIDFAHHESHKKR